MKKMIIIYALIFSVQFFNANLFASEKCKCASCKCTYITTNESDGFFAISKEGKSTSLLVSSDDFPGVRRVASHLQSDIYKVTNAEPELIINNSAEKKEIIIIGTITKNPLIDKLIVEGKLDVKDVTGKREVFVIDVIENPFQGVEKALIIAGSDKRGTIFGIYDLAEKIGVSPWHFWADVPAKKKSEVYVKDMRYTVEEPKVKYRGIFINDEAPALTGWAFEKYGGFNSKFYEHVFELIMRLKGNFLWPAMWGRAFYDDDPENPRLADEYGVVISTSHHEPMMRAHDEWRRYGSGPWNYEKNEPTLREFWRTGIERMGEYESIVTLAMRGDGDEAMSPDANVSLLQKIVQDQREILADVTKKDVTTIPQVWALYKEVQEYYDKGMRVPDDVTLLLCDDNWGNVRKLPYLKDEPRKGGYGIYYHFDFVGGPRNYKWLNTTQIEKVWEQMYLSYEYGAREIWIVNVGDIKPMEFPISFFLDFAWNPEKFSADDLPGYYVSWAEKQFGADHAKDIAEILQSYTRFNSRRKPEMLSPQTYSLVNFREAETVVKEYNQLADKARMIYEKMPADAKDAFYQLVLHPVEACANLNELYVTTGKNRLYAGQGRALTNKLAVKVKELFNKDAAITDFYHQDLANGKWNHMMSQTHIGYTNWQQPDSNSMPEVINISLDEKADMGVAIEGSVNWWPDSTKKAQLPEFDKFNQQSYYIEIFNRGKKCFEYKIVADQPWIIIQKTEGEIMDEQRVFISIDWENIPSGKHNANLVISGTDKNVSVNIVANNPTEPLLENFQGFIEANGYVSIESVNYTRAINSDEISWIKIPGLGRTTSAMTTIPVTVKSELTEDSPRLEYDINLYNHGEISVDVYFSPILNYGYTDGLRYAISIDNETPQIININANEVVRDWKYPEYWNRMVSENIKKLTSLHIIDKPGKHTLKFWIIDPGVVLQKIVLKTVEVPVSYLGPPESFRK